jgi:SAM-dependent methyltransferase
MSPRPSTNRSLLFDAGPGSSLGAAAQSAARPASGKWEQFAQKDPHTYILTSLKSSDPDEFRRSGERTVGIEILPLLQLYKVEPLLGVELGCGVGRLAIPLARHFQRVIGADIAPSMVQQAASHAAGSGIKNISFIAIGGPEDLSRQTAHFSGRCDFIYSLLVFQHIPEFSMIEGYLQAIRALLRENGLAYLQFDTRPQSVAYRLKTYLPDVFLPRFWRRGIRRIRRSSEEIEAALRRAGLEIVAELDPHTAYHRYILRLPQRRLETR